MKRYILPATGDCRKALIAELEIKCAEIQIGRWKHQRLLFLADTARNLIAPKFRLEQANLR